MASSRLISPSLSSTPSSRLPYVARSAQLSQKESSRAAGSEVLKHCADCFSCSATGQVRTSNSLCSLQLLPSFKRTSLRSKAGTASLTCSCAAFPLLPSYVHQQVTRIYHPNVTDDGAICIGLLKVRFVPQLLPRARAKAVEAGS